MDENELAAVVAAKSEEIRRACPGVAEWEYRDANEPESDRSCRTCAALECSAPERAFGEADCPAHVSAEEQKAYGTAARRSGKGGSHTIGLCMIVKDEARVIGRCLESVLPLVDAAVIVDTGSTDRTKDIVAEYLGTYDVPGCVASRPWVDFATTRNEALELLRKGFGAEIDYVLMIDADEELVISKPLELGADWYNVTTELGNIRYFRTPLFRNVEGFRWRGVVHEFLETPSGSTSGVLDGAYIRSNHDGARSADPEKYYKDAKLITSALGMDQDPFMISRYYFYLAQSWRDAGHPKVAIAAYERRAALGGWNEEIYISLLNAARLKEQLRKTEPDAGTNAVKYSNAEILGSYMLAVQHSPKRLEAIHDAARFCRRIEHFAVAVAIASIGLSSRKPVPEALFSEQWIYDYGLMDEYAVSSYWAGFPRICKLACEVILQREDIPSDVRERVQSNLELCQTNTVDKIN